ncbi:hypothetical protein C8J56DRAFT_854426 [Mycena floridula]|nr:hypothetical protein C8J56DRAFT_854426 [Mycena floridula]
MLFEKVQYHLPSSLCTAIRSQLSTALNGNGAVESKTITDATHIISNSLRFEGWQNVDPSIAVVTPLWVDRSMLLGKLQPTECYSTDPEKLFSGVVATSTEMSSADSEILSAGIITLGGQWRAGLTKDVTHLFATSEGSDKYVTAMHYKEQTGIRVLLPHWFDDVVKLGMSALDTSPYEWPEPLYLTTPEAPGVISTQNTPRSKRKLDAEKKELFRTAVISAGDEFPERQPKEIKDIWQSRRILLSDTLRLTKGRENTLRFAIRSFKGVVIDHDSSEHDEVDKVNVCDVFITQIRSGKAYIKAARHGKTIGTLAWLFHVHNTGVISRPVDQLLHYPIPKKPITGFSGQVITITNYTGEAREYLKKLINTMGGEFTPSMSSNNTVLIAAFVGGTKTTKAQQWSIAVVNHMWLEDCFIQWKKLTTSLAKYIDFSPSLNHAPHLGERGLGKGIEDPAVLDELEAEEAEEQGAAQGEVVPDPPTAPLGTENSAKDVREVADYIELDGAEDEAEVEVAMNDDNGNWDAGDDMDVEEGNLEPDSSSPPKRPSRLISPEKTPITSLKTYSSSRRPQRDDDSSPLSRFAGKSAPKSTPKRSSRLAKESIPKAKTVPMKRGHSLSDSDSDFPRDVPMPSSSRSNGKQPAKQNLTDTESESELPRRPMAPPKSRSNGKSRHKPVSSDSELSDPPPDASSSRRQSGKLASTRIAAVAPKPTVDSFANSSPKRLVVLMPSLEVRKTPASTSAAKIASSSRITPANRTVNRTSSIQVIAAEKSQSAGRRLNTSPLKSSPPPSSSSRPEISSGRPRRNAATVASQRLADTVMPDVLNYQHEMKNSRKRKSGGAPSMSSRRPSDEAESDEDKKTKGKAKASSSRDASRDDTRNTKRRKVKSKDTETEESDQEVRPSQQRRIGLMTSIYKLSTETTQRLTELGVKLVDKKASDCTHLLVPNIVRTEKFLCALAFSPFILQDKWAVDSAAARRLLPEEDYALVDKEGEAKFGFTLKQSLENAKKGKHFANMTFYVTPSVSLGDLLKKVAVANGGQVNTTTTPTIRTLDAKPKRYVISCEQDFGIWKPISTSSAHRIYSTELMLSAALKQEVPDFENKEFWLPGSY